MQKAVNVLIFILTIAFLFACATTEPDKKPFNVTKEAAGDTMWMSNFSPISVKIDKSFDFVAHQEKSDQRVRRHYHVWKRASGEILYIVDLQVKSSWTFPEDYEPTLGKDQNINDENILLHKSMQYTIWKGIHKNSYRVLKNMGIEIPACKAAINVAKISPSRKSGVWVIIVQENPCGQYGSILDDAQEWITFQ